MPIAGCGKRASVIGVMSGAKEALPERFPAVSNVALMRQSSSTSCFLSRAKSHDFQRIHGTCATARHGDARGPMSRGWNDNQTDLSAQKNRVGLRDAEYAEDGSVQLCLHCEDQRGVSEELCLVGVADAGSSGGCRWCPSWLQFQHLQ